MSSATIKLESLTKNLNSTLKNSLTQTFKALVKEIHDVMDEVGENKDEYVVRIYPWALDRLDGKPVPEKLLLAIKEKLQ